MINRALQDRNTRMGIRFFLLYAAFYLAFVLVNAFAPHWGEWNVVAGLNLAVLWGFALIGLAFILALLYGLLCSDDNQAEKFDKSKSSEAKR